MLPPPMVPNNDIETDKEPSQPAAPSTWYLTFFAELCLCFVTFVGATTIFIFVFFGQVMKEGITLLRKPLAYLICLWLLVCASWLAFNSTVHAPLKAVSHSLCALPFAQHVGLCPDNRQSGGSLPRNAGDFLGLVKAETQSFELLLDQATGASELSLKLKKAEYAVSDLAIMVKLGSLENKDLLADTIENFCQDARRTAKSLQFFSSKVSISADQIIAYNIYALRAMSARRSPSISSPIYIHATAEETAVQVFDEVLAALLHRVTKLILIAESLFAPLESLEDQLDLIQELVFREEFATSTAKHKLLSRFWTKLGGNQQDVRNHDGNLKLLRELGAYRHRAKAYVTSALQTLHALNGDLDGLREETSNQALADSSVPIEVQTQSIGLGIQKLRSMIQAQQWSEPSLAFTLEE